MSPPQEEASAEDASKNSTKWPKLGTRLGEYVLKDLLGQGGMGRVYLAVRSSVQRQAVEEEVALKILDPVLAKRQMIRDFFLQEAMLGRDLNHPNLVAFVDQGELQGFLYLAFEYIHGVSLDKLIKKKGPFDKDLALSVLEDVTFGLAAAHLRGIVHRDLKPQNVMITPDNVIKVIDFGLADADQGVGEGRTVGTPVYAAPEQNLAKKTGPTADIYSLGLMTYEMFSGSRLLPGGGLKKVVQQQVKLQKVLEKGIPLNPRIPKELSAILRKMLEFKPSERFTNASELAAVLEKTLPQSRVKRSEVLEQSKSQAIIEIADTHYWKSVEMAREGKFQEAATECRQLVALRPPTLVRLKGALRKEIVQLTWDPRLGGPVDEGEIPPRPDLEGLENLANMASAAELIHLKFLLHARLARLAQHYDVEYWRGLRERCWDSVPLMKAILQDPRSTAVDRIIYTVPLAWCYLALGCPNIARSVVAEGLDHQPGNPALMAAQDKINGQLRDREAGRDAIVALERVLDTQGSDKERVEKVVQFATNNPYLPEARELQIKEASKASMPEAAADAHIALGMREYFEEEPGLGLDRFIEAFKVQPTRSETVFFVLEALRQARRTIQLPTSRDGRTHRMYRLIGHQTPLIPELEAQLDGGPEDIERLRELAAIASEEPSSGRVEHYLLRLASTGIRHGLDKGEVKAIFEQALGIAQDRSAIVQAIRITPGVEQVFGRLELARLTADGT